ncbi:MAG: hypothetical protein ABIE43_00005 [Patescibacteria group bacterium]
MNKKNILNNEHSNDLNQTESNNKRRLIIRISIISVLLLVIISSIIVIFIYSGQDIPHKIIKTSEPRKNNNGSKNVAATVPDEKFINNIEVEEGWRIWKHDILGLEFIYPETWGEPVTSPSNYITDLATINSKYSEDNIYKYAVIVSFENGGPDIEIYNNEYPGEKYPNSQTYYLGAIDNFKDLIKTNNICEYKIEFKNNPTNTGTVYEKYSECQDNIKTAFFEDENYYDWDNIGTRYQYYLKHYGFKKLQNNFFDNLLATFIVGYSGQLNHTIDYKDFFDLELINKGKISPEQYEQDKSDFTKFVNSIKIYKPKFLPAEEFKIFENENPDITIIRKYYYNIESGNLPEAYDMYLSKKVSFDEYKSWYENTIVAKTYDISKLAGNKYQYMVDLHDQNNKPAKYRVTVQVENGKLDTLLSEEITSEFKFFNSISVFTKNRLGYNYIILDKDSKEIVIEKAPDNYSGNLGEALFYVNPAFSPLGNYLTYQAYGWEWSFGNVYDISKNKIVLKLSSMYQYGFSNDEKYFYACGANDMGGDYLANVYLTSNFQEKIDLFEVANKGNAMDVNCQFNKAENKLVTNLSCFYSEVAGVDCNTEKVVEYDFNTGSADIIE